MSDLNDSLTNYFLQGADLHLATPPAPLAEYEGFFLGDVVLANKPIDVTDPSTRETLTSVARGEMGSIVSITQSKVGKFEGVTVITDWGSAGKVGFFFCPENLAKLTDYVRALA